MMQNLKMYVYYLVSFWYSNYTVTHFEARIKWPTFADVILKCMFLIESIFDFDAVLIHEGPVNINASLAQVVAWCR